MRNTVFFGPFIGEFGWELLFWQGWVRRMCRTTFRDYRKVAASLPGREPFYPEVDEFRPIPKSFRDLRTVASGYHTLGWRGGYPGRVYQGRTKKSVLRDLAHLHRPWLVWKEEPVSGPEVELVANELLATMTADLPRDTVLLAPWKWIDHADAGGGFGVRLAAGELPTSWGQHTKPISFGHQEFDYLRPTPTGTVTAKKVLPSGKRMIAVFPRHRPMKRADKDWPRENYEALLPRLREIYPEHALAIFGEPGGSYFVDGAPNGSIDLINVDDDHRMDIQVAALGQCDMAVGGMSGALLVALAAGCPAVIWGEPGQQVRYHRENFMGTPMIYQANVNPPVDTVMELAQALKLVLRTWKRQEATRPLLGVR